MVATEVSTGVEFSGRSVGGNVYRGGYRHVYGGGGYGYGYNGYGYNGCYGNYNGYCGGNPGAAIGLGILGGVLDLGGIP